MIKFKKYINKILIGFMALVGLITSIAVPTFAYHEDSNGNLVSDNLYSIGSYSGTSNGVSMSISNQTLTLNGTSTNRSWDNRFDLSITLNPGTYTMQWFTDYTYNDIGFGIFNSNNTDLANLYVLSEERYRTFTISEKTTFYTMIWWSRSNMSFDNVKVSCMVYEGNYKAYTSFEPYGATYYKDRYITDISVMDYSNIAKAYINHHSGNYDNPSNAQTGFIYQGQYGFVYNSGNALDWGDFETDLIISDHDIKYYINSNYGSFYHTPWSMWQLITWNGAYPLRYVGSDTLPISLTYEFITPINLNNVGFDMGEFDYLSFYDSNGFLLGRISKNDNVTVAYSNVSKIVGERHISDIPEDILYIASSLSSGYYDLGYKDGYNNGYNQGIQDGKENALDIGYQEGYRDGKIDGYDEGYDEALGEDITTRGFWGLLNSIMSYPVNMIKSVFNFEFMGINISALITFIISIVIVVFVVHKFKK